jgi:PAS domain S-box-containing protein
MKSYEDLLQSETRYRTLFEFAPDSIILLHPERGIIDCNFAASNLFAVKSRDDLIGLHTIDLSAKVQTGGIAADELIKDLIQKTITSETFSFEWQIKRLDGSVFPSTIHVSHIEIDGEILLQGILHDISDKKALEKELEQQKYNLLKTQTMAKLGSWEWDLKNSVFTISKEMAEIYGIAPEKQTDNINSIIEKHIHPDDIEYVQKHQNKL